MMHRYLVSELQVEEPSVVVDTGKKECWVLLIEVVKSR